MTEIRVARPDDPAARPLLDGLADEYATSYGEKTNGELAAREVVDFVPPRGVFLLAALYHASGYERIAPFGRYRDEPLAVAFEKRLTGSGERGRTQGFDA